MSEVLNFFQQVTNITDEAIYSLVRKHTSLERVHLSYCDQLSVKAIAYLLNKLAHIKHLSLTGVSSFKVPELQEFCRPPPDVSILQRYAMVIKLISTLVLQRSSTGRILRLLRLKSCRASRLPQ